MFPGVYGFSWSAGHVIFVGVFLTVVIVVATTVALALARASRDMRASKVEELRWFSDFHDLPARDRACRHAISGELMHRVCEDGFDCRGCRTHNTLFAGKGSTAVLAAAEEGAEIFGLSYPADRLYHRGHTWARPEDDGTITVGLDDLGTRLIGPPDSVDLPRPGSRVHVNGAAWRMNKRGVGLRILSPVEGEVLETGGPLQGWYLKVRPPAGGVVLTHLLSVGEVRTWLMRELERLQLLLAPGDGTAPSLADGGVPVDDIPKECPGADWDVVWGEMFLHP